jgi:hypothetical protein
MLCPLYRSGGKVGLAEIDGSNDLSNKPHPLPSSLLPVSQFKLDLTPEQLRPWVADVCERMHALRWH